MNQDKVSKKNSRVLGRENNPGKPPIASPTDYKTLYEQEVVRNRNLYLSLFQDQKTIMIMVDVSTMGIVDANEAAVSFYGYPYETLIKMYAYQLSAFPKEKVIERIQQAANQKEVPYYGRSEEHTSELQSH